MTRAIICDGCLIYESVDTLNESLEITESTSHEVYHLCTKCTKNFHKWLKGIEERV